jgi:hypothetical protein
MKMVWQQAPTENFEIAIPPRTYYRISQNLPAPILAKKPAPFFRNHREKIYPSIQVVSPTALHQNSLHFHQTGKDGQRVAHPTRLPVFVIPTGALRLTITRCATSCTPYIRKIPQARVRGANFYPALAAINLIVSVIYGINKRCDR